MYTPHFSISSHAINLIADISAQIEHYAIRFESEGLKPHKANRIPLSLLYISWSNYSSEIKVQIRTFILYRRLK